MYKQSKKQGMLKTYEREHNKMRRLLDLLVSKILKIKPKNPQKKHSDKSL